MYVLYSYVLVDWLVSHAVRAGKDTRKQYRVVSSTLDLELYTFVLFIQIQTSRYLESNISLEVNDRTYMHIATVCKDTVSPEFFTQWLTFYFLSFVLAHVICFVLTGQLVKKLAWYIIQKKAMRVIVQQYFDLVIPSM